MFLPVQSFSIFIWAERAEGSSSFLGAVFYFFAAQVERDLAVEMEFLSAQENSPLYIFELSYSSKEAARK